MVRAQLITGGVPPHIMDRNLHIGLFSPYDFSSHGGVNQHIKNLQKQFLLQGHSCKIVAPSSIEHTSIDQNFIRMGGVVPIRSRGSVARISLSLWLMPKIKSLLTQEGFDVLHLHEPFAGAITASALSVSSGTVPVKVATFHTSNGTNLYKLGFAKLAAPYFRKLDGRIAVSPSARDFIARHLYSEFEIIPNGIDLEEYEIAEPAKELMDGKLNILFVGRFEQRKGLRYLISAYCNLRRSLDGVRLIIAGSGELDPDSARIIAERGSEDILLKVGISDEYKASLFRSADIFCAPSTGNESFGIVLLEAMATSTTIVASNINGYSSLIINEEDGFLCPPKDENALTEILIRLVGDKAMRERVGQSGHKKARDFSWDIVSRKVLDYYSLVGRF